METRASGTRGRGILIALLALGACDQATTAPASEASATPQPVSQPQISNPAAASNNTAPDAPSESSPTSYAINHLWQVTCYGCATGLWDMSALQIPQDALVGQKYTVNGTITYSSPTANTYCFYQIQIHGPVLAEIQPALGNEGYLDLLSYVFDTSPVGNIPDATLLDNLLDSSNNNTIGTIFVQSSNMAPGCGTGFGLYYAFDPGPIEEGQISIFTNPDYVPYP